MSSYIVIGLNRDEFTKIEDSYDLPFADEHCIDGTISRRSKLWHQ
jgi:hypothetical protein